MNQIDFFGCSFTEAPAFSNLPLNGEFDILKYAMHCQTTKPTSNFLEYDLRYNSISNFIVNNYGGGSFGNHVIKEVIKNKVKTLDKSKNNLAIVQLSALLRNEMSFNQLFFSEHSSLKKNSEIFLIDPESVKNDYFVNYKNIDVFYKIHLKNLEEIIDILQNNYSNFYIHFGWDIFTKNFLILYSKSKCFEIIKSWKYDFNITPHYQTFFENHSNFIIDEKRMRGKFGGMLEYSSNKVEEKLRYVHINDDHHPSYFSNKIFYLEIIRPFILNFIELNKNYFELDEVLKFENFLAELLPKKESTDGRIYGEMQAEIVEFIRSFILKENE